MTEDETFDKAMTEFLNGFSHLGPSTRLLLAIAYQAGWDDHEHS